MAGNLKRMCLKKSQCDVLTGFHPQNNLLPVYIFVFRGLPKQSFRITNDLKIQIEAYNKCTFLNTPVYY